MKKFLSLMILVLIAGYAAAQETNNTAPAAPVGGTFDATTPNRLETKAKDTARYILMYIPNRLIDLSDVFSLSLGIGPVAGLNVGITDYMDLGGAYGNSFFVGKEYNRQYGFGMSEDAYYSLGCFNYRDLYVKGLYGTINEYFLRQNSFELVDPNHEAYKDKDLDMYAVNARAAWLFDVSVKLHPVALADFVCGIFFYDLESDDIK